MAVIGVESMAVKGDDSQSNFWQSNTVQLPAKIIQQICGQKKFDAISQTAVVWSQQ